MGSTCEVNVKSGAPTVRRVAPPKAETPASIGNVPQGAATSAARAGPSRPEACAG